MKKKKTTTVTPKLENIWSITPNKGGKQIRLRSDFAAAPGDKVIQFIYDPNRDEPRPGDLVVRKINGFT